MEEICGKPFDEERFIEAQKLSNEAKHAFMERFAYEYG